MTDGRLYNLDIREENFWYREARRKSLSRRLELMGCMRLAQSTGYSFGDEIERLQFQLDQIELEELDEMDEDVSIN